MDKRLTQTEHDIMDYIWNVNNESNFKEILDYFNLYHNKNWKKQTLSSFMRHLIFRNYIKPKKVGRKVYYTPQITREKYEQLCAQEILEKNYNGKLDVFLAALNGGDTITEETAEKLIKIINSRDIT